MPILKTQKDFRARQNLAFCYLCGKPFKETDVIEKDHVPPQSCFDKGDRTPPLKLPTHQKCHDAHDEIDEKTGQLISLKYRKAPLPKNARLKFGVMSEEGSGRFYMAMQAFDIRGMVCRWVKAFHAALYGEIGPDQSIITIETPFPSAVETPRGSRSVELRPQHLVFVRVLKRNRMLGAVDRILSNNGKLLYECVWSRTDDGRWICVFGINLYEWKDLGDIKNFVPRGCAGGYLRPNGQPPVNATKEADSKILTPNYDKYDPFGR